MLRNVGNVLSEAVHRTSQLDGIIVCALHAHHNEPADETRNHHLHWRESAHYVAVSQRDAHLGTSSVPFCFFWATILVG